MCFNKKMVKRKKNFPLWFKIETIIFLIFSVAIGASYFNKIDVLNEIEAHYLLIKLFTLIIFIVIIWLISFILCYCNRFNK